MLTLFLSDRPDFIRGLILLVIGFFGLVINLGMWHQERTEIKKAEMYEMQLSKRAAWERYYGVELKIPLDQIKEMPKAEHLVVAGVDLTLHGAIQNIQSTNFDSIHLDDVQGMVFVNVFQPLDLKPQDQEQYLFYQALVYSTIIRKLIPDAQFKSIGISAYSRGGKGYLRAAYDFKQVANLMRFGYEKSYYFSKRK